MHPATGSTLLVEVWLSPIMRAHNTVCGGCRKPPQTAPSSPGGAIFLTVYNFQGLKDDEFSSPDGYDGVENDDREKSATRANSPLRDKEFVDEVENPLRQEPHPPKIDDTDNAAGNDGDGESSDL